MQIKKTRIQIKTKTAFTIFLVLAITLSCVFLPLNNTVKGTITFYPYCTVAPNPVGVGQQVIVVIGFTMPTASSTNSYSGWTVTATDPNGTNKTITGLNSDPTGSTYCSFVPDKVGIWKVQAHYPEETPLFQAT